MEAIRKRLASELWVEGDVRVVEERTQERFEGKGRGWWITEQCSLGGGFLLMNRRRFLVSALSCLAAGGLGNIYWQRRWKYIVVHHSAGSYGNIKFLQKVHRERQPNDPINAIPYHYVIGNGHGMKLGEVASDWRQSWDLWGTHVSANNRDHNFRGIGICLIGNFEKVHVPAEQYRALVHLTKALMGRYGIHEKDVNGHGMIPGESTKCPGKHFPMETFRRDIGTALRRV